MLGSVLGKKIGMTQLFTEKGQVVPVTVIDFSSWFVTQVKTGERDGYAAVQLGLLRNRYKKQTFDTKWIKNKAEYFAHLKEVSVDEKDVDKVKVGNEVASDFAGLKNDMLVSVTGKTRGLGFQGVVKRWGFKGGGRSHGSNFHRIPGSIGNICAVGRVAKGKKLPGQYGNKQITVKGLKIVDLDKERRYLFVKGAIPGKKNSVVIISKQG